ncbi:MAG: helix-turn-helix transcriptional regulator [Firmicutes bacterium]|jgi:transcriptional regulator with XRE-family HTH domain|nr:helix-turn-helix transcriptional regulator [Bacillota bacterium]
MILADKIIELRKKNGWSQEELAEMLDVSRQSISKWEGAQSVPDMNRILRLSEVFGVSTDFLLKDELTLADLAVPGDYTAVPVSADPIGPARTVTMEEAVSFMDNRLMAAARISIGVLMCILSPVLLILLGSASDAGLIGLNENQAAGLGLVVLILLIGGAVALFVTSGLRSKRYEYLDREPIETLYGVDGVVRERRERFRGTFTRQLVAGIVLCVLSALPLFITLMIFGDDGTPFSDFRYCISIAITLVLVAIGVFFIVRSCVVWGGFQRLLETGEYTREQKLENKRNQYIDAIYWCSVTAIYLAWSFITFNWQHTWIIWPIAGVAYGVLIAVLRAVRSRG